MHVKINLNPPEFPFRQSPPRKSQQICKNGRGNVLVARNSHMRAAGTLPLPFDQDTNANR